MANEALELTLEDNGKAVSFRIVHDSKPYCVKVLRKLLDDALGSSSSFNARKNYVIEKHTEILDAAMSRLRHSTVYEPFASGIEVTAV